MEENLYKLINEKFNIKSVQAERVVLVDGSRPRYSAFVKFIPKHLKEYLNGEERLEFIDMGEDAQSTIVERIVFKVCEEQSKNRLREEIASSPFPIDGLDILVEMVDQQEIYYLLDRNLGEISEIKYSSLKRLIPQKHFTTMAKLPCKSVYEPFAAENNFNEILVGQRPLIRVNTYKHPEWRQDLDLPVSPVISLPESTRDFLRHIFPCKLSREYVLDWIYEALMSRQGSEQILVLNGPTGTGKTIFATELMIALFRLENWGSAPKDLFNSKFNPVLKDKRIIFIDEAKINESDYNTVKLYANKKLNIEKKGIDANNSTDLFYSMILSNNKMGNIYVDPDDRRFSIVETTNVKLKDIWSSEKINDFVESLKDPEVISQIGKYLIMRQYNNEKFTLSQFREKKFYQFVWRHLSQWNKIICNRIFEEIKDGEEEIDTDKLRIAIKNDKHIKYDVQLDTIIEFIQTYRHGGLHKLGEVVVEDGDRMLKFNSHLLDCDASNAEDISEEDLLADEIEGDEIDLL